MDLECLLVTRDPVLVNHVQTGLAATGASIYLRQDYASAAELISRRHLDGLLIDCDDVPQGANALTDARRSRSNKQTLILAVVNGFTTRETAIDLGANFVLSKPIQAARMRDALDLAVPKMEREHRRYFRHEMDLPIRFRSALGVALNARIKNVSEGGMAIRLADPLRLDGVINVEFDIPSLEAQPFHAKAEVIWCDSFVAGIRFLYIAHESATALQGWLKSLDAQLRLKQPNGS